MKTAGIIGGSGYTGGELLRLILNHPALTLDFVYSTTRPGFPLSDTHLDLLGSTSINFTDQVNREVSVVFLCLGHGNSSKFLKQNKLYAHHKVDIRNKEDTRKQQQKKTKLKERGEED